MHGAFGRRSLLSGLLALLLAQACASAPAAPRPPAPAPALPDAAPVVIVGAGLTGLVAAYELKKQGIPALVLEQAPRIGGRVQSVRWPSGADAEAHMEEYWERSPAVPLLQELGLVRAEDGDLAHSSVRLDGRIYPYQGDGARDAYLAGIFDPAERAAFDAWDARTHGLYQQLEASFFAGKPLPPELERLTHLSLAQWVAEQGLPRKVSEWIRVTVEPEMSVEWTRVSALDGIDELRLFLTTPERFGERNYHVPDGNTRFTDALAERVGRGSIVTSARVTALVQDGDGVTVRVLQDEARFTTVRARAVLVTVPLFALPRIQLSPALPEAARRAVATTRFGAYVKVVVGVRPEGLERTKQDGQDTLVLLSDSPAGSIYHATDDDLEALAPDADRLLTLLVHGEQARRYCTMGADEVREAVFAGLEALFPGIRPHLTFAEVFQYPTAVAYWPVEEGRSRFDALAQALRQPHGRVLIGGDTTENSHSEGAVIAGQRMARQVVPLLGPR